MSVPTAVALTPLPKGATVDDFIGDCAFTVPEDRSINYSVRLGYQIAEIVTTDLS